MNPLRSELVRIALAWEQRFGVAPHITSAISEYDAACLVGCAEDEYCRDMHHRTAVGKGFDFMFRSRRFQVKANRPSGKPRSTVTLVGKANNYEWDTLVWILYDRLYDVQEAWQWQVEAYRRAFDQQKRLGTADMRKGQRLA